ncbi:acylphosphatase [Corynebacterium epidermidicanis]|uniref:acylphosphatase n=1 Tax=Corynebacterium epidermidicanis TaxID=1050174 RepID=A0A0G3GX55_9CORY|nr:acylphosphatase [Corynebacterium epidermidicanis]AKK03447.1 acylphosphatase [Corynebacterium epidermidicanis]
MENKRLIAFVHGTVQGVGFRWWTKSQALELGLAGSATNLADGRVYVVAEGPAARCEDLLTRLKEIPTNHRRPGEVTLVVEQWGQPQGEQGFRER